MSPLQGRGKKPSDILTEPRRVTMSKLQVAKVHQIKEHMRFRSWVDTVRWCVERCFEDYVSGQFDQVEIARRKREGR